MGLLHKNLILASVASVAMVGLLCSSSASALDGFSFSDIINQQQAQREQLLSYLINPFGTSTVCESTNPDSTISCNESLFPELLYNRITDGAKLYGHDGKGIIFTDAEQLVDNNPQLRTANRGDTLDFSAKFEMERYYDDAKTMPITRIELAIGFSEGLVLSENSVSLRINNQLIPAGEYSTGSFDFDEDEQLQYGVTGATVFNVPLYNGAFVYPENSTIELLYSATVGENAAGEVYGRTAYAVSYINGGSEDTDWSTEEDLFSDNYQATAMLDGNIVIKRIDGDGSPISGAKYTVDGVKADIEDEPNSVYRYNEEGEISEFTTNDEGLVVIKGAPFNTYTANEVFSPQGEAPVSTTVTQDITQGLKKTEYGKTKFTGPYAESNPIIDYTDFITTFSDGRMGADTMEILKQAYPDLFEQLAAEEGLSLSNIATYDEESGVYTGGSYLLGGVIRKNGNSFILGEDVEIPYDPEIGAYRKIMRISNYLNDGGDVSDNSYSDVFRINGDGTASFNLYPGSSPDTVLTLDEKTGCYSKDDTKICKDGDSYVSNPYHGPDWRLLFSPTDTEGRYSFDYEVQYYVIKEIDANTIEVAAYAPILHPNGSDNYYIAPLSSGIGVKKLTVAKENAMASVFLFQGRGSELSSVGITNPQTADTVVKAAIIVAISLTPIFIFRKQLTKRAV